MRRLFTMLARQEPSTITMLVTSSPEAAPAAQPPSGETSPSSSNPPAASVNPSPTKKKRRPAGTPDPDAEMVALSPRTLMESDRYVCDICNQGFQREQNLQMHRRRHKVPWKLARREGPAASPAEAPRKRAFVCPEKSCLHHDPAHALGDLVGIKKHYRRKHSDHRQWCCARCSKSYAVHSDFKAHLKTCGTRGHSCDCGRVFSRVESFIEHQDSCNAGRLETKPAAAVELQLLPASMPLPPPASNADEVQAMRLELSIGLSDENEREMAEEARREAKRTVEQAEREFEDAKRVRQQAQAELKRACVLRDAVARHIESMLLDITCHDCRRGTPVASPPDGRETTVSKSSS